MLFQNLSIVDIQSHLNVIKFNLVRKHLKDNSNKHAGTVPEGIIVRPVFRHLDIIVSLKSGVVFYQRCEQRSSERIEGLWIHALSFWCVLPGNFLTDKQTGSRPANASSCFELG